METSSRRQAQGKGWEIIVNVEIVEWELRWFHMIKVHKVGGSLVIEIMLLRKGAEGYYSQEWKQSFYLTIKTSISIQWLCKRRKNLSVLHIVWINA